MKLFKVSKLFRNIFCRTRISVRRSKLYYSISVAVSAGEGQTPRQLTFSQLRERVAAIAAALSAMGVAKGDVVAGEKS